MLNFCCYICSFFLLFFFLITVAVLISRAKWKKKLKLKIIFLTSQTQHNRLVIFFNKNYLFIFDRCAIFAHWKDYVCVYKYINIKLKLIWLHLFHYCLYLLNLFNVNGCQKTESDQIADGRVWFKLRGARSGRFVVDYYDLLLNKKKIKIN